MIQQEQWYKERNIRQKIPRIERGIVKVEILCGFNAKTYYDENYHCPDRSKKSCPPVIFFSGKSASKQNIIPRRTNHVQNIPLPKCRAIEPNRRESGAAEYDECGGPIRSELVMTILNWQRRILAHSAVSIVPEFIVLLLIS